ncbi:flippase-like domain-containing protein [Yinghuangia sp. ASG 101]|uniref:lysylphosphatidylglycerol synthase transmembrane domain-containing protein n=1 Tax=Yinghuangia sp. ASG 101 TaxID=2896848 RepID=UPI001E3C07F3|nr:flippase-like domain-containing protein [Yinghuangia sp. ASG 101]UGQ11577.1 flippase-like domain-containing protein [Yinghuangia sp. ASG 101]
MSAVLVAATAVVAVRRRHDLVAALHLIEKVRPAWLGVAALLEALALLCQAGLQRRLLVMGGARLGLGPMSAMVVAANAVAGALPGGAAFAAAWLFGQFRQRRVPAVLAGSVLVVSGLMSGLTLFALLVVGVLAGGRKGPAELRTVVLWSAVALVVVVAVVVVALRFTRVRWWARRGRQRIGRRSRRMWEVADGLAHLMRRVRTTRPGVRPWLTPLALALANWLLDAACLAACAWGLGITLPWRGVLIAYALTQMTGALRLTPGGLGIVETSLAALLVLYGLPADQAIALTLLYRIVSYWALQPIGWTSWLGLTIASHRRGTRAAPDD